jgi:hypothetical protein
MELADESEDVPPFKGKKSTPISGLTAKIGKE